MGRLEGKVALITGGAGGIGAATARLFCEEGARVALVDLEGPALEQVAAGIRREVAGARLLEIPADVGKEAAAADTMARVLAEFTTLDVLVNLAGIRSYEPLTEAKAETWQKILAVNLLSYAYLAKEALPALRQSGHVRRAMQAGRTENDLRTEKVDHNLQRRWADAEVAFPIHWLASDEASFVTASTVMVDGGTRV